MTPQPRPPIYHTGHEGHATSYGDGVVRYTAPCATCRCLATYVARPDAALRVTCPTCEAKP